MLKDIDILLKENQKLLQDKAELLNKLIEANEVIEAIKKGNIDAVFTANEQDVEVLVYETADQTYRKFVENMSEGVVTLHVDGIIVYSNSSFATMLNMPLEKVIGANFRKFIPADQLETFERFFAEDMDSHPKMALSVLNDSGGRTHFVVSVNRLQIKGFEALNLVFADVTDQKKTEEVLTLINKSLERAMEERSHSEHKVVLLNNILKENIKVLENANAELAAFAHIASHDLQEPLRKISTYSSLLKRDYSNAIDEQGQTYIKNMQGASERMRALINDILEFSELSNQIVFKPTNLQSIIDEVCANLAIVIKETSAKINIKNVFPVIDADPGQMKQLFRNLISNSLKFRKADVAPLIQISCKILQGKDIELIGKNRHNEQFCVTCIKDNGIGFNPEYKNKIFSVFQKLHSVFQYKGTGIGLAICKKIAEQHNGYILAESILNEGCLFSIVLPVKHAAGPEPVVQ